MIEKCSSCEINPPEIRCLICKRGFCKNCAKFINGICQNCFKGSKGKNPIKNDTNPVMKDVDFFK